MLLVSLLRGIGRLDELFSTADVKTGACQAKAEIGA
jgi:hypothetical protein